MKLRLHLVNASKCIHEFTLIHHRVRGFVTWQIELNAIGLEEKIVQKKQHSRLMTFVDIEQSHLPRSEYDTSVFSNTRNSLFVLKYLLNNFANRCIILIMNSFLEHNIFRFQVSSSLNGLSCDSFTSCSMHVFTFFVIVHLN